VAVASLPEGFDDFTDLLGEIAVVRGALAAPSRSVEVAIELFGRLDRLGDERVAFDLVDHESGEDGDGAGGGDLGLLQPLQADELAHGGVAAEHPLQLAAGAGVETSGNTLCPPTRSARPAVRAVLDQRAVTGEVAQGGFELRCGGGGHRGEL